MSNAVLLGCLAISLLIYYLYAIQSIWTYYWAIFALMGWGLLFIQLKLTWLLWFAGVYFTPLQAYGCWYWYFKGEEGGDTLYPWSSVQGEQVVYVLELIFGTILLVPFLFKFYSEWYPWAVGFMVIGFILGSLLLCQKKIEAWIIWVVVDVFAALLFFSHAVYIVSFYFALHFIISVYGLFLWTDSELIEESE